ncbi:hypothetical protein VTN96DRAFT_2760 [Rasamsonia emersonii]|uniref:DUF8035 domain-containing protein n=1 Tax=Rasamsonia emersonii (strain ATCC 16479 / CBS 393.64 / IMI 116815) TaxID=1408163 RepID=A0A0F4YZ78_RASE3|nr:hypothetical protein T310_2573 [Rasamsonia emersonii CBS 393.64]KKA23400.1 hypothetical protein T310_2573 [Rasamsonia emersonii CBS 393.64]
MSHSGKYRSSSPGGRRIVDPMRASTGTVTLGSSGDIYNSPTSYYGYDGYLSTQVAERVSDYRSGYEPRRMPDRKLEAQPISSVTYRDASQSTKLRTEYAIRPRPRSSTVDSNRYSLSLVIPTSKSRQPPVITSAYERSTSPLRPRSAYGREDAERYITPASSIAGRNHRRIYSSEYRSDAARSDRARRDRSVYRVYRPSGVSAYSDSRKRDDSDYYDAYSYTSPRDLFEKDSAVRSSQRGTYRTGRPLSMTGAEAYLGQSSHRKDSRSQGPPPSQRGFDRIVEDRLRRRSRSRADSDASRDPSGSRRLSWQRTPVSLHQDRDDAYLSYPDDLKESRRHRRRHYDEGSLSRRHRDHRDSRRHTTDDLLEPVLGGLATLGLASGYSEDADPDRPSRRERNRSRGPDRGRERESESDSESRDYRDGGAQSKGKGLTADEVEYRRRRRRERSRLRDHSDSYESSSSEEELRKKRREKASRKQYDSESSDSDPDQRSREDADKPKRQRKDDIPADAGKRSPDEDAKDRAARKPAAVEPTQPAPTKEPEAPPKGILKPPRDKFPEDENPIREGVAPPKDAQKKGIPPGARWTKIDRRLVNPAALEAGHERFEERPEYVIVLRVLTKEEIQAYAVKTQEIRDARYRAMREERRRRREERRRNGENDSSSSDDEDDDDDTPLAIEAPPEKSK